MAALLVNSMEHLGCVIHLTTSPLLQPVSSMYTLMSLARLPEARHRTSGLAATNRTAASSPTSAIMSLSPSIQPLGSPRDLAHAHFQPFLPSDMGGRQRPPVASWYCRSISCRTCS